jgi:hypothetical protein
VTVASDFGVTEYDRSGEEIVSPFFYNVFIPVNVSFPLYPYFI